MHKNYDYVISGSKEMNLFFAHAFDVPIEKVKDIGTPSADYLLKENKSMVKKLFDKYPQLKKKQIFYIRQHSEVMEQIT